MSDYLNPYQKQSLQITLQMLEENLRQLQALLPGASQEGILYHYQAAYPAGRREELHALILAGLEEIAALAERFSLPRTQLDPLKSIGGAMSVAWANLIDSGSGKLARFGPVDPALPEHLDPALDRLAGLTLQLSRLLSTNGNVQSNNLPE